MARTPLSWLAERYTLGPRSIRAAAVASVVAAIGIIMTGGVVRVTGSGLGCPDWPMCTDSTLAPTAEMGLHGAIEFSNRMLTSVLCVVVGWVIIAARLQRTPMPQVLRGGWAQFWVVVLNAVVGGVTVWLTLSPYIVATHFLAAVLLLTTAVVTWDATLHATSGGAMGEAMGEAPDGARTAPSERARRLATALMAVAAVMVVAGTVTSGTGPHAGDSSDVPRIGLDWTTVTVVHGVLAAAVLVLAALLFAALRPDPCGAGARRRTVVFLVALVAQGLLGVVQSLTALPAAAVILHLLGAAMVWVGALRVLLAVRPARRPAPAGPEAAALPAPVVRTPEHAA
ncbi:COX15/CtaA family protein [Kitasatospora sp. NPDC004723]|uniref:COX15/CtaA family protein n=1 Tax=Kitasatospora sp. NPDC004723 TaxID=3154288 RepID=UPI0033A5DF06